MAFDDCKRCKFWPPTKDCFECDHCNKAPWLDDQWEEYMFGGKELRERLMPLTPEGTQHLVEMMEKVLGMIWTGRLIIAESTPRPDFIGPRPEDVLNWLEAEMERERQ